MPRRRFQKGTFIKIGESYYSMFYTDSTLPYGEVVTKQVKRCLGNLAQISERAARREHARIMEEVNRKRGSIASVLKGQSFTDAVERWRAAIAPNLSPGTVRSRESFLRNHLVRRFSNDGVAEIGVHELQTLVTELRKTLSAPTVSQILATFFGVMHYAEKCGYKVQRISSKDLELGAIAREQPAPFFTRAQVADIIQTARDPYKTVFAIAWFTGLRAGEILALTVDDLSFDSRTIRVWKSADDATREVRNHTKGKKAAILPMPSALETMLRDYLTHYKPSPDGLLFPAPRKNGYPRSRDNVVRYGLKPVLKKLGIPDHDVGLHAFRHALATELAERSVPITTLQAQMRHANIKTTLQIYSHVIPQTHRDVMENLGLTQSLPGIITLPKCGAK